VIRKDLHLKSVIFKIFFTYIVVYFFALIFKYTYDFDYLLKNIKYEYLIVINIISIFLGLPLSIIFDFLLIEVFGFYYVLFFSPILTIISFFQVLILRNIKFKFSRKILFLNKKEKNNLYKFFENVTFNPLYILIIRSFPVLPHVLGSFIIASSKIKRKTIMLNTFLGSIFYYIFLFLIIGNV